MVKVLFEKDIIIYSKYCERNPFMRYHPCISEFRHLIHLQHTFALVSLLNQPGFNAHYAITCLFQAQNILLVACWIKLCNYFSLSRERERTYFPWSKTFHYYFLYLFFCSLKFEITWLFPTSVVSMDISLYKWPYHNN